MDLRLLDNYISFLIWATLHINADFSVNSANNEYLWFGVEIFGAKFGHLVKIWSLYYWIKKLDFSLSIYRFIYHYMNLHSSLWTIDLVSIFYWCIDILSANRNCIEIELLYFDFWNTLKVSIFGKQHIDVWKIWHLRALVITNLTPKFPIHQNNF